MNNDQSRSRVFISIYISFPNLFFCRSKLFLSIYCLFFFPIQTPSWPQIQVGGLVWERLQDNVCDFWSRETCRYLMATVFHFTCIRWWKVIYPTRPFPRTVSITKSVCKVSRNALKPSSEPHEIRFDVFGFQYSIVHRDSMSQKEHLVMSLTLLLSISLKN